MKCPWRPVTVIRNSGKETRTNFAECYQGECPFYSPEHKISENLSSSEGCSRAIIERKKAEVRE